jgi:hypothetical protein
MGNLCGADAYEDRIAANVACPVVCGTRAAGAAE